MTTKISFTILDEIAEQMNRQTPDLYFDVFGKVVLRKSGDLFDTKVVGQWWRE